MSHLWRVTLACLGCLLLASAAAGQAFNRSAPDNPAPVTQEDASGLDHALLPDGALRIGRVVMPGYYIHKGAIKVSSTDGPIGLDLPNTERITDMSLGESDGYRDDVTETRPPQGGVLNVAWQGCDEDGNCTPAQTAEVNLAGGPAQAGGAMSARASTTAPPEGSITVANEPGLIERLGGRGIPILLLAFFGFGLALAFTPCVLPMVPILGGLLARDGAGLTRLRGFTLSSSYVIAMAAAFGLLGLAAAATGQNLQLALQSSLALALIAALFVTLALSMFGLFEIRLADAWVARLQGAGANRRGTVGDAVGLGFTSALIVGPCVTAPLAAALLYIAQTGDMALGSAALFMLGLGKGAPLIVFGTLGSRYLPRSGQWMIRVKQGFGFVFLGLAIWLAERIAPGPWFVALWAFLLLALGIFLLRAVLPEVRSRVGRGTIRALATLVLVPALVLGLTASRGAHDPLRPFDFTGPNMTDPLPWQIVTGREGLQAALASAEGPAIIYLAADWCLICRRIESRILPHADVVAALAPMQRIKVDLTDFGTEEQTLLAILAAAGPPTMIFLDADRREKPGTRLVGDTRRGALLQSVRRVTH